MGNDVTDAGDKFRKLSQQLVAAGDEVVGELERMAASLHKACQERDEWRRRCEPFCDELEQLRQQLATSREEWADERKRRIEWQDTAYAAFRLIDAINGNVLNRNHVTADTCSSQVVKARVKLRTLLARRAALEDSFALIDRLTQEEGCSVTLLGANPEFDGPDYAVLCSGEWTGWHEERYEGATLNDALRAAADAKSSRLPENYPPRVQQTAGLAIDAGVGSGKFTATNQPPLSAVLRVKDDKNV